MAEVGERAVTNSAPYTEAGYGEVASWRAPRGEKLERGRDSGHGYRYYCTETGRYLTRDPIGYASGTPNIYGYVANNPINHIDPLGLGPPEFSPEDRERIEAQARKLAEATRKSGEAKEGERPKARLEHWTVAYRNPEGNLQFSPLVPGGPGASGLQGDRLVEFANKHDIQLDRIVGTMHSHPGGTAVSHGDIPEFARDAPYMPEARWHATVGVHSTRDETTLSEVFYGDVPTAPPDVGTIFADAPGGVYGRTKRAAEQAIIASSSDPYTLQGFLSPDELITVQAKGISAALTAAKESGKYGIDSFVLGKPVPPAKPSKK